MKRLLSIALFHTNLLSFGSFVFIFVAIFSIPWWPTLDSQNPLPTWAALLFNGSTLLALTLLFTYPRECVTITNRIFRIKSLGSAFGSAYEPEPFRLRRFARGLAILGPGFAALVLVFAGPWWPSFGVPWWVCLLINYTVLLGGTLFAMRLRPDYE